MKLYTCSNCHNPLYFENSICLHCKREVGFDAHKLVLITSVESDDEFSKPTGKKDVYKYCQNKANNTCNWLLPIEDTHNFCIACQLNRTIPNLSTTENLNKWSRIEIAKHRLVYSLLRLNLPVKSKWSDEKEGLFFDFMADVSPDEKIMTGHDEGIITININEADEAQLVRHKLDLGERYRTLLGHFRHEIGHYYWDILIKDSEFIEEFRQIFGDERADYEEALKAYYQAGLSTNWADHFISPYSGSHPWEDWAETWAHYLHLMDTLETAYAFGIDINPKKVKEQDMQTEINHDPYTIKDFGRIIKMWLPLTFALNSLTRSMGHPDFYPFIISEPVIEKLKFIHELCYTKRK